VARDTEDDTQIELQGFASLEAACPGLVARHVPVDKASLDTATADRALEALDELGAQESLRVREGGGIQCNGQVACLIDDKTV
jgi:hypothetical protein